MSDFCASVAQSTSDFGSTLIKQWVPLVHEQVALMKQWVPLVHEQVAKKRNESYGKGPVSAIAWDPTKPDEPAEKVEVPDVPDAAKP